MLINNKNEDNNQNDEKTFTQTEINEMQVSRIRHLVNLFADMNECYDMAGLFIRMQQELSDVCKEVRLKSLICEISTKSDNKADLTTEFSTTIYDVEGPEFDSINYDLQSLSKFLSFSRVIQILCQSAVKQTLSCVKVLMLNRQSHINDFAKALCVFIAKQILCSDTGRMH